MYLLDPLLVDFPPVKGCSEVYADKKSGRRKGKFPLGGCREHPGYLFFRMRSSLHILKVKICGFLRFFEDFCKFQRSLSDGT